jgi:hypothetical protein
VNCLFNIQGYQLFNALLPFKDYSVFMDKDDIDFWEREKGGISSFLKMILYFHEYIRQCYLTPGHGASITDWNVSYHPASMSACQPVCLSACLSICQPISLSVSQPFSLSVSQCVSLSVCKSVSLSVCESANLSVCQYVSL